MYATELSAKYREVRNRLHGLPVPVKIEPPPIIPETSLRTSIMLSQDDDDECDVPIVRRPKMSAILAVTSRQYGVKVLDVISERRTKDVILPRHVAMYLGRELTTLSYPMIGRRVGRKDHTTILSACRKITRLLSADIRLAAEIDNIKRDLGVSE